MRFALLGSGSRGNGLLVEAGDTLLLTDCGFTRIECERRLNRLGRRPADLSAILVTHEHSDHGRGVECFARHHALPVYASCGTATALALDGAVALTRISPQTAFTIGDIHVRPYPVPHDAREPTQFVFEAAGWRLGLLTDAGHVTPHIEHMLGGCDALILECNHDVELLANGPYPPPLRARVGGDYGHLNNRQSAGLLARLHHPGLGLVVAAHLSEKNNQPGLAKAALAAVLAGSSTQLELAAQDAGLDWRPAGATG
jgi:phosphoribosyl 1,2-cyclic phosphodiesterase